ncbi:MAG: hypothetical protein AAFQ09_04965 [Pseudomonadota bacterium]
MTQMILTKTQFNKGIWAGELTGAGSETPNLQVTYLGEPVDGPKLRHDPTRDVWQVEVPVPTHLLSDGVQTFVISDADGRTLNSFALLAGDALTDDIRAEMDLLRAELDLLKVAFRRHCSDT